MSLARTQTRGAIILLILGAAAAGPRAGLAQASRAEAIAKVQENKAAHLQPEGPSWPERAVASVFHSPLLGGTGGFYPWFSRVYSGTGLGVGAGYHRLLPNAGRLNALAAGSLGGSSILDAQAHLPEVRRGLFSVTFEASRVLAKRLRYFGSGPRTVKNGFAYYDLEFSQAGGSAFLRPAPWLQLTGGYKRLKADSRGPAVPYPTTLQADYDVFQAGFAIDWRTSPGYSTRGGLYRVSWSRYSETRGRPYSFDAVEYEVVQLLPLVREQYVLAFHGLAVTASTGPGHEVPFTLTPTLGGTDLLRGYATRRFTDRNMLLLTGEYRWRPSRFLDMAIFFDAGKVAARRDDLNLSGLETDWGFGARFHGPTFTAVRVEAARGREGWRLIISAHQAF